MSGDEATFHQIAPGRLVPAVSHGRVAFVTCPLARQTHPDVGPDAPSAGKTLLIF